MSDFTLQDGREINFDLNKLTHKGWTGMFNAKEAEEKSDATIARVVSLSVKEVGELPEIEYRKLLNALIKKVVNPINDPNA